MLWRIHSKINSRVTRRQKIKNTHLFFFTRNRKKSLFSPARRPHRIIIKSSKVYFFSLFSALYTFKFIRWNYVCANLRIIFCPPNSPKNLTHPEMKRKWPPFCSLYFLFSSRYYRLPIQLLCRWLKNKRILQKIKLFFKRLYEIFPKDPEICFATAKL